MEQFLTVDISRKENPIKIPKALLEQQEKPVAKKSKKAQGKKK